MTDTTGAAPQPPRQQPEQPQQQSASPVQTAPQPSPSGIPIPENRYGAPRGGMSRARKIGLGATGLMILAGVVGYIGWQQANPAITGTVLSYSAGNNNVSVTFEVDKPSAKTASCTIAAEDVHNNVVGSIDVQVPAGRGKNVMSYVLSTTGTPNTVIVQSCALTP
jgi:hypothetical protein